MRYVNSHISTCLDRSQAGKVVKTGFRSKIGTIHARIQVLDSCWETKICNEMIALVYCAAVITMAPALTLLLVIILSPMYTHLTVIYNESIEIK